MGNMQFNGTPEEWEALVKKNKMINKTKQTAVEWLIENENYLYSQLMSLKINIIECEKKYKQSVQQAKEMEKERELNAYANGQADTLLMFKQKISKMKDIPTEFNQIISENFWDLV
jgi:hypothetical protein